MMIGTIIPRNDMSLYRQCAEWCNKTQQGIIVDKGDYYEVVATPTLNIEDINK